MESPLTPNPTRKAEVLVRTPPTIPSCREEDTPLRLWSCPRYYGVRSILETETKVPHIHWVERQNKLEIPKEKDEVNKREVHECDVRVRDPDTMVVPPTPKPTFKAESPAKAPPTIASSCEGNAALKKWHLPRLCCAS
jgi:hypothetical protein